MMFADKFEKIRMSLKVAIEGTLHMYIIEQYESSGNEFAFVP